MKKLLMFLAIIAFVAFTTNCEKDDPGNILQTEVVATIDGFNISVDGGVIPYTFQVFKPGEYTTTTWLFDVPSCSIFNDEGITIYVGNIIGLTSKTKYWLRVWDSNGICKSLGEHTTL